MPDRTTTTLSLETRRLYARDWAAFADWCQIARHTALPATPATIAAYLATRPTLSHGALARRMAAIAERHRRAGHTAALAAPLADSTSRALLRNARRVVCPTGSSRPVLPGPVQLARMAARCQGDLAGQRDRALLLLAAAGLSRERLCALDHDDIQFTAEGVTLDPRPSSGGGAGVAFVHRRPAPSCPVRALEAWLRISNTRFGPVFRKVDRWGNVEHGRLRPDGLRRIWHRHATRSAP